MHKPKRVKKKSRRVDDRAPSSSPDPKRGKGSGKDERGRRPTTNERLRRSDESNALRTQNEPGESRSSHFLAIYLIHVLFYLVFLKPPSPVSREKATLKPPPTTMPGSLFPRSPSMFPDFAPVLRTPCIQRISVNAPLPTLKQPGTLGAEVHPTLEDPHIEADISSGASS